MNQGITGINLIFSDGEMVFVENSLLSDLYIANIDEEANEIPYEKMFNTSKLYANFFILKVNHLVNETKEANILKKAYEDKNLLEVELQFENKKVSFHLASDIDPFKRKSLNSYDKSFFQDNDLCMVICPYDIKYKKYLFA